MALALVAATVGWSLLAVGGVYLWASLSAAALGLAAAAVLRPGIAHQPDTRWLDWALLGLIAAIGLQLLPLSFDIRLLVSPQLDVDRRLLLLAPVAATWRPLTLDPASTTTAFAVVAAVAAVFWSSRHLAGRGHVHRLVQVVAIVGLVGAAAAILQRAVDPTRIYGLWLPQDAGARPFGPFVNRNHFATWLLMAASLSAGSVVAGLHATRGGHSRSAGAALADSLGAARGVPLLALAAMALALVLSLSRAAFAAAAFVLATWCLLAFRRVRPRTLVLATCVVGFFLVAAAWTSPQPLLTRVQETVSLGAAGRTAIWRDAEALARTYRATGAGLGAYERAMLVHQTTDRGTRSNHAHNQYLHTLAEGGLLVTVPLVLVGIAFLGLAARRLLTDDSPAVWLRIGAMAGLVGVAVQCVWETGLRMPANGVLLAVVAAVATHRSGPRPRAPGPGPN